MSKVCCKTDSLKKGCGLLLKQQNDCIEITLDILSYADRLLGSVDCSISVCSREERRLTFIDKARVLIIISTNMPYSKPRDVTNHHILY